MLCTSILAFQRSKLEADGVGVIENWTVNEQRLLNILCERLNGGNVVGSGRYRGSRL